MILPFMLRPSGRPVDCLCLYHDCAPIHQMLYARLQRAFLNIVIVLVSIHFSFNTWLHLIDLPMQNTMHKYKVVLKNKW